MSRLAKVFSIIAVIGILAIGAFFLLFPKIGAWAIRDRVLPKLEERLDRRLTIDEVKVGYGSATLAGVTVAGPADAGHAPLARISRVRISFDFWKLLTGKVILREVVLDEPRVEVRRDAQGKDNVSDLLDRLRAKGAGGGGSEGGPGMRPAVIRVTGGWVAVTDELLGIRATIDGMDVVAPRGGTVQATLSGARVEHRLGPHAAATTLTVSVDPGDIPRTLDVAVSGGSAVLWPEMSLTGITGTVAAAGEAGKARLELHGGYGGVDEALWRAEGSIDLLKREGDVQLRADRFTLDKIEKVLAGTPIQSPGATSVDAALDLSLHDHLLRFSGALDVQGLTVYHPWLAVQPVRDLRFGGQIKGLYETQKRVLSLDELKVSFRGLEGRLDGSVALVGGDENGAPRAERRLHGHLVVPPIPCQQVLSAIPEELAPRLRGFGLTGNFAADLTLDIDWARLDDLVLDGSIGIAGCKVVSAPNDFTKARLLGEFQQVVEVEENNFISFQVGPSNPDFVPLSEVSPYLLLSLQTTEDSGFMKHHGFIVREFRSALIKDLKEGYFKYGASSITMQLVKNVFLDRQKTLSRKLQELFLTWYVETILPKERLLEIYVNVIEFGPGLYGIGAAARHYFGKKAKDLNPVEAAFFSSILPSPKKRYMQYCEGELNRFGDAKVQRILKLMLERGRLTPEEYAAAMAQPLVFDRTEALPEDECKRMTKKMIENARPTQPRGG